ncbi:Integrator complex subunit 11, related [Eimeria acervulina]|uniref:Integrator complex subunit 11, related n=1 Tax=Eimeria acervulina TaxID=5801 RepID=U6GSV6_EIMAC|nr:Integrator complex subunit 11, related [Eimeria acervulina]CDI81664.1 Integrator complex subunit 11, related [Eimeria acervulina]
MQMPFHRQLLLQERQQPTPAQHHQQAQQPPQRQLRIDRRKSGQRGDNGSPRTGTRGGDGESNSAKPVDAHSTAPPWAHCPLLQPPTALGNPQNHHFLKVGSRIATDGKSAAEGAAEPLKVTVLGAGQDVGRSAVYVRRGERGLLFDCGSHLGAKQARKLPVLNMLLELAPQQNARQETQTMEEALLQPSPLFACCTDATLISHFHMDHCGSLPSFTERLG